MFQTMNGLFLETQTFFMARRWLSCLNCLSVASFFLMLSAVWPAQFDGTSYTWSSMFALAALTCCTVAAMCQTMAVKTNLGHTLETMLLLGVTGAMVWVASTTVPLEHLMVAGLCMAMMVALGAHLLYKDSLQCIVADVPQSGVGITAMIIIAFPLLFLCYLIIEMSSLTLVALVLAWASAFAMLIILRRSDWIHMCSSKEWFTYCTLATTMKEHQHMWLLAAKRQEDFTELGCNVVEYEQRAGVIPIEALTTIFQHLEKEDILDMFIIATTEWPKSVLGTAFQQVLEQKDPRLMVVWSMVPMQDQPSMIEEIWINSEEEQSEPETYELPPLNLVLA